MTSELSSELGVAAGGVEATSAAATADGTGTDVALTIHLPDSLTATSGRRLQAALDAAAVDSAPLATRRASLFPAVARLLRRGVAINIADGACCTAALSEPRLARPVASVQSSAAAGPVAFVARDVPSVTFKFTVANAPTSGGAVTTLWLAWTLSDGDADPVPTEGPRDAQL